MTGPDPSRDTATRTLARDGSVDLVALWREDRLPAYTAARDVAEAFAYDAGLGVTRETSLTRVVAFEDVLRLLAFAGLPEARAAVEVGGECPRCSGVLMDHAKDGCVWGNCAMRPVPRKWEQALAGLWAKLPPHDSGVPAERWGMAAVAAAVAWECFQTWHESDAGFGWRTSLPGLPEPREATLVAAAAWIADPTREREQAWTALVRDGMPPGWCLWIPAPFWRNGWDRRRGLLAAADVLGADRVREIASAKVRELVLP